MTEAKNARNLIVTELSKRRFLRVAADRREFLDKQHLFGIRVTKAFPSAAEDIRSTGNCLAAECPTAAVFHAMRTAEHGLRALAYDRHVLLPRHRPIVLATWEEVLRELQSAESEIQNYPKTLAREAQYEFFHDALLQVRAFKNAFRNQVMHTRKTYDRGQALRVVEQVRDFMQGLARHISENKRTPRQWRGKRWLSAE